MTKIIVFILTALLTSRINSRYPTNSKNFNGGLLTCISDSTSLINENFVKIKQQIKIDKKCINCKYSDCHNKPDYFDIIEHWPSYIGLDFEKKTFFFITNPESYHPDIKYGQKGFEVHYDVDGGKLKINKKSKEITLSSDYYNWKRTFNYEFSKTDSTLTLKAKNGY